MIDRQAFAKRLKGARESLNLRQYMLANAAGISPQTISLYENGTKLPTLENAVALAQVLNVSLDWLILGNLPNDSSFPKTCEDAVKLLDNVEYAFRSLFHIVDNGLPWGIELKIDVGDANLISFFQKDEKMAGLLNDEIIDLDLYRSWRAAELCKLREIKLDDVKG